MSKRFRKHQWPIISVFLAAIIIDWIYIFSLSQKSEIITHWVIVSPIMMTFFLIVSLAAALGIYYARTLGFLAAYMIIIASTFFIIFAHHTIYHYDPARFIYLFIFILMNLFIFIYLLFFKKLSKIKS